MFQKKIQVENKDQMAFGSTTVSYDRTKEQLMALLRKHGCDQIITNWTKEGEEQIGFQLEGSPYFVIIPRVYVRKGRGYQRTYEYDDKIGIRLVFHFLKTVIELSKTRVVKLENVLLGARMVKDDQGNMSNVTDYLLPYLTENQLIGPGSAPPRKDFILKEEEEPEEDFIDV